MAYPIGNYIVSSFLWNVPQRANYYYFHARWIMGCGPISSSLTHPYCMLIILVRGPYYKARPIIPKIWKWMRSLLPNGVLYYWGSGKRFWQMPHLGAHFFRCSSIHTLLLIISRLVFIVFIKFLWRWSIITLISHVKLGQNQGFANEPRCIMISLLPWIRYAHRGGNYMSTDVSSSFD